MPKDNEKEICCSFCGKSQDEVTRLVEGPGVYICDTCIEFCNSLLFADEEAYASKSKKKNAEKEFVLPKPQEIKAELDRLLKEQRITKEQADMVDLLWMSEWKPATRLVTLPWASLVTSRKLPITRKMAVWIFPK